MGDGKQQLEKEAAATGVPGDGGKAPLIFLGPDINRTARELGEVCAGLPLFELNGDLIFFDHNRDRKIMTARIFRSWINDFVVVHTRFNKDSGDPIKASLEMVDAATILDSPSFRPRIRRLTGTNQVRLPVLRENGTLELLPWGYDDETGVYTVPGGLEYNEEMDPETADLLMRTNFGGFPFSDEQSWATHMGACLTLYIKHLLPDWCLRPGFLYLANKQGSGKSVLAKAALYPVLGTAAAAKLKSGEELDKELEAFTRAALPYIFLDNVYGSLSSASLDALITSEESTGRSMGGHEVFTARNTAQILVTGNNLELNDDATRRFLVIDLFEAGEPGDRVVEDPLNGAVMRSPEWRAGMLAALWAMVRTWDAAGRVPGKLALNSFEEYSAVLGGIVQAAGYVDPFKPSEIAAAVNPEKVELMELMGGVLEEMGLETERSFTLEDLARIARSLDLFSDKVGTADDGKKQTIKQEGLTGDEKKWAEDKGYMTPGWRSSWSKFLKPKVGSAYKVGDKTLTLGDRALKRKLAYLITVS